MIEQVYNLVRRRGDTYPIRVFVTNGSEAEDITGCGFLMTADPSATPTDATNNIFQLTGTIVSESGGEVIFEPSASNTNYIGTYYYDIQKTDPDGVISTLITGSIEFVQDVTKS